MIEFTIAVLPSHKDQTDRIAEELASKGLQDGKIFPRFSKIVGTAPAGSGAALASVKGVQTVRWSLEFTLQGSQQ